MKSCFKGAMCKMLILIPRWSNVDALGWGLWRQQWEEAKEGVLFEKNDLKNFGQPAYTHNKTVCGISPTKWVETKGMELCANDFRFYYIENYIKMKVCHRT